MAFRFKGRNHAGQEWRAAGAIETFGKQIEVLRPGTFGNDGTVASKEHDRAHPTSDHGPNPRTGTGIVRALDFHETSPGLVDEVLEALRLSRDPRISYVIHDGRMFSSYKTRTFKAWGWRPYTGDNPHRDHGHLSVVKGELGEARQPFSISLNGPLATDEEEEGMWQYLTVDESLVRHAWKQGWLQPKTQETLDFFLDAMRNGTINDPSFGNFENFRVAVTNGIARSAGSS
jgi:hypothetical protein